MKGGVGSPPTIMFPLWAVPLDVDLHAHRDGQLKEEILVRARGGGETRLIVTAGVLHKHAGTPMLRNGVRCVGQCGEDSDVETEMDADDD